MFGTLGLAWARFRAQWSAAAAAPIPLALAMALAAGVAWLAFVAVHRGRDAALARAEREIADYRAKLDGALPDQARARVEALENRLRQFEALESRLRQLEARPDGGARPGDSRHLNDEQRRVLADNTVVPPATQYGLVVSYEMGCADCTQYAEELQIAIAGNPGWVIGAGRTLAGAEKAPHGLAIQVADPHAPPPAAIVLAKALAAAGLKFDVVAGPFGAARVGLLVTARSGS